CKHLLKIMTLKPKTIYAVIDRDNIASKKLIKLVHFRYFKQIRIHGKVHNIYCMDYERFDYYMMDFAFDKYTFLEMKKG
ncbi:MAG: hypothetical protein J5760_03160, partial [Clostridia bacterium]|nr:hypothetical protein [Clostridia bacterium]